VPETALCLRRGFLTFGRPPHRQLWRGCAARLAGGEALRGVVVNGTQNCRGRSRRGRHFGGMEPFARRRHLHGMERKSSSPSFFTERTLADFLAVSDRTIRNWIRRGELPSYKLGAARRIDPADVENFLARHRDEAS
jgi:excisionase family DNA binding protein